MPSNAWIADAVRTPVGRYRGALSGVRPDDLAAATIAEVVRRSGLSADGVDEVFFGCANGAGEDNRNVARMASLLAGLPHRVPGVTLNRLCGSGMDAVIAASRAIRCDEATVALAGGVESMSRAPWVVLKPERRLPSGPPDSADSSLGWRFVNRRMAAVASTESMGETAENVAAAFGIGRNDQDAFALGSHQRALAAQDAGTFEAELISIPTGPGDEAVTVDEAPRADTTIDRLASLKPVFRQGGTVTAGNSSPLNDGAAALLVVDDELVEQLPNAPLARVLGSATVGVDPAMMGMGPVPATRLALQRAGLELGQIGQIELNEAFASQSLACIRELGADPALVNPDGGAIALGHPLGSTGARIVGRLARSMKERGHRYGLATMCVGVGQGVAIVLENPEA